MVGKLYLYRGKPIYIVEYDVRSTMFFAATLKAFGRETMYKDFVQVQAYPASTTACKSYKPISFEKAIELGFPADYFTPVEIARLRLG